MELKPEVYADDKTKERANGRESQFQGKREGRIQQIAEVGADRGGRREEHAQHDDLADYLNGGNGGFVKTVAYKSRQANNSQNPERNQDSLPGRSKKIESCPQLITPLFGCQVTVTGLIVPEGNGRINFHNYTDPKGLLLRVWIIWV